MTKSTTATTPSLLRPWQPPAPERVTHDVNLYMMNSLTRKKERFITMDGGRHIRWYMCGPIVSEPCHHIGHARTYIVFDVIRRILQQYFGYDITLLMNVNDIPNNHYEEEFFKDMQLLRVSPPDILTRSTEYIQETIHCIQTILDKGLAYKRLGSVYFHVEAFEEQGRHAARLVPEQAINSVRLAQGEAQIGNQTCFIKEKRGPRDFALWKRSNDEPSWDSPWGKGRPSWHIQCSAVASSILTQLSATGDDPRMDIHSGSADLKFPHHCCEMAQAEAESGCEQWVNYFLHSGQLNMQSVVTIREALEHYTARQLRLCFLLHKYNAPMDNTNMSQAIAVEKQFRDFFHNVKAVLRESRMESSPKWGEATVALQLKLQEAKQSVEEALCDDFDTPTAFRVLADLVKATNMYLKSLNVMCLVIRNVAVYVTRILRIFGLTSEDAIGFSSSEDGAEERISKDETLAPVLDALLEFRSSVRDRARVKDVVGVLDACDSFRDKSLPSLGIQFEDKTSGRSVWKLVDPEELERERRQRELGTHRKEEEKSKAAAEQAQKDELHKLSPEEFMKLLTLEDGTPKYSKFDDSGMPTHTNEGVELNKNQSKKALKEYQTQRKKYENYKKRLLDESAD